MSADNNNHSEQGIILLLVIPFLIVFALLAGIVWNIGNSSTIQSELQAVADSAAHAGAASLCSTQQCYRDALSAAKDSIRRQLKHGNIAALRNPQTGSAFDQPIDAANLDGRATDGPVWESDNLIVTIRRGRWWPDDEDPPTLALINETDQAVPFESFDLIDGSSPQANTPPFMGANAVSVKIELRNINLLSYLPFSDEKYDLSAEAFVTGGFVAEQCVAPFAIPVSRLLDENGEFDPLSACEYERFFTATNRYCEDSNSPGMPNDEANCNVLPGFSYTPLYPSYTFSGQTPYTDESARWAERSRGDYALFNSMNASADHFGVVGLPAGTLEPTEENIRNLIANTAHNGCVNAKIGQEFRILRTGLRESESDEVIWNRISSAANATTFMETDLKKLLYFQRDSNSSESGNEIVGSCNSHRIGHHWAGDDPSNWVHPEELEVETQANGFNYFPAGECGIMRSLGNLLDLARQRKVWRVPVPIIAQGLDGSACAGINAETVDPPLNPNRRYVILGFVTMHFFDGDVGYPPPNPPNGPDSSNCFAETRQPWGFELNGTPTNCNVVRAKIARDTTLIPSADHFQIKHAGFVEKKLEPET